MVAIEPIFFLSLAVFLGGFVSGISGFAFSAVAGTIILHFYPPTVAIPLMMGCALLAQIYSMFHLRASMRWLQSLPMIVGGLAGIPIGLYALRSIDPHSFRVGFGIFLVVYSAYMLLRSTNVPVRDVGGKGVNLAIGFAAGVLGGLTAFPGALPTIWCDLRGLPKDVKRGITQPFIAIMQFYGVLLAALHGDLAASLADKVAWSLPALLLGTVLGLALFGKVNDLLFRRIVLSTLLVSGLALV